MAFLAYVHLALFLGRVGRQLDIENSVVLYDTRCYFNVRSKADMSRLNLPHGNDN